MSKGNILRAIMDIDLNKPVRSLYHAGGLTTYAMIVITILDPIYNYPIPF